MSKLKSILMTHKDTIVTIIVSLTLSLLFIRFVACFADIPSGSMESTLNIGDRIIVNRLAYINNEPERGDIIVFKHKMYETDADETILVKRIIGVPGDTIEMKQAEVYINGIKQEESYMKEPMLNIVGYNSFGPVTVPDDSYFVMGDNRNNSLDSRYWDSMFVTRDSIWGKCDWKVVPNIERLK